MNTDVIFGLQPLIEAFESGKEIEKIMLQKGMTRDKSEQILQYARERQVPVQFVPIEKLNRITRKNHQGIIANISPIPFHLLDMLLPSIYESGKDPFLLILDRITDVRNFGAIVRTAECAGVDAVIIPSTGAAGINSDAIKTSSGALMRMPICREKNLTNCIKNLKDNGIKTIACTEKTEDYYYKIDMTGPIAMIAGSEEDGISTDILRICDYSAKIPLLGKTRSLNVSNAVSILLYEVVKQKAIN